MEGAIIVGNVAIIDKRYRKHKGINMTEKQSDLSVGTEQPKKRRYSVKSPSRGGARTGAGRPKGSTNKIPAEEILEDFKKQSGMKFSTFINMKLLQAHAEGNQELVSKYIATLGRYLIQDKQEIDVTSNGQTMGTVINLLPTETGQYDQK